MTSFFDKLSQKLNGNGRGKQAAGFNGGSRAEKADVPDDSPAKGEGQALTEKLESKKLEIDLYQCPSEIVIYALAAGVDPDDFDVILDEENDLLTIKGARKRPLKSLKEISTKDVKDAKEVKEKEAEGKYVFQECLWEPFQRRIILPIEVDAVKAEAFFKKGVLIVVLPIRNVAEGRKLKVTEALTSGA